MTSLFKPQINYLLRNGPTIIGSSISLLSEKSSCIIGCEKEKSVDRFEMIFEKPGGSVIMVILFDYKHPYNAPDFIIVKDGQSEVHGENYIDYDSLESLKTWNIHDPYSLAKVLLEIFKMRTVYNLSLVKNMVPLELQIARDIDEMFGAVMNYGLFDITVGADGHVYFCYPHSLRFLNDNNNSSGSSGGNTDPCPICCLSCELDLSVPTEPAKTSFKLFYVNEEMNKMLSKAVLSKYSCVTPFKSWLYSVDECFKKVVAQEYKYLPYLREFMNVFGSPLYYNPPEYNIMAFAISDSKFYDPAILRSIFK